MKLEHVPFIIFIILWLVLMYFVFFTASYFDQF